MPPFPDVKVVILCGGQGTRMREETEYRPKPMVEVGGRPLLWHIMKIYAAAGLTDFVCCLGYRGSMIKQYFLEYRSLASDVSVNLQSGDVQYHSSESEDWNVTLVDTGDDAMTGARVKRVAHHLAGDLFLCTYGDGLADIDVAAVLDFHRSHGKLATLTGVHPPSRFGEVVHESAQVARFSEKPAGAGLVSGGFFVFDHRVLDRLSFDESCVLERGPLEGLAADGELMVYEHGGFWQCADTVRDVELLRGLWDRGTPPWRIWDDRQTAVAPSPLRRRTDLDAAA
jgi:glucose-1-phosphate cytidylyltransferase